MIHNVPTKAVPAIQNVSATDRNIKELIDLIEVLRTDREVKNVAFREAFFQNLKQYIV